MPHGPFIYPKTKEREKIATFQDVHGFPADAFEVPLAMYEGEGVLVASDASSRAHAHGRLLDPLWELVFSAIFVTGLIVWAVIGLDLLRLAWSVFHG